MAFLTLQELLDAAIMTVVVGCIFMDAFLPLARHYGRALVLSIVTTAPGILLHELGHKLVALAFGLGATFHAAYFWLGLGALIKYLTGMSFFIPAYVSITCGTSCTLSPLSSAFISFAGPGINLILYLIAFLLIRYDCVTGTPLVVAIATKKINGLLFLLNMLPLPGIDGFHLYTSLTELLFS